MRGRGNGPGRDIQRLGGLGLRQPQDVAADDHLTLAFGELRELDEKINLVLAARHMSETTKGSERSEQPMAPAVPFPGPRGDDEEPPFGPHDRATLPECVLESVLQCVRRVLGTGTDGDEGTEHLRIRRFTRDQPLTVGDIGGNRPREPYLHVLKCRGYADSFSDALAERR